MNEAVDQHEFTLTPFETRHVGAAVVRADRQFNIALVVATVAHLLFFTSFISAGVRQLGDPGGSKDGISVDIVSEADLQRIASVADRAAGAPVPPPTPPPQKQAAAAPPEPQPPQPKPPEPQAQPKAEPPPHQTAALPPEPTPPPRPQEQPKAAAPDQPALLPEPAIEKLLKIPSHVALPHSLDPPKPQEPTKPAKPSKSEDTARPSPRQRLRTSSLDLSLPPSFLAAPFGGAGVGVGRPAGVTRSGENDGFARGVIAALQRSMPQLRETRGRVTVRIKLDKDGSLVGTEVIIPSNVAGLDQSVVFSTRQASFPFPPRNATAADLIFLVTYIYH